MRRWTMEKGPGNRIATSIRATMVHGREAVPCREISRLDIVGHSTHLIHFPTLSSLNDALWILFRKRSINLPLEATQMYRR